MQEMLLVAVLKANFTELHRSLENANINYTKDNMKEYIISLSSCFSGWKNGNPIFISVLKTKRQHSKIKIDQELWVVDDNKQLFAAYIEILYQVRCALFHGNLSPIPNNERVIRALYLTLAMVMEKV